MKGSVMKKGLSFVLAVSLFVLSDFSLAAERRHGAVLLLKTWEKQEIEGELLAVIGTKLFLLDLLCSSWTDVEISTVQHIRIVKRVEILRGMTYGFLIGAGGGVQRGISDRSLEAALARGIGLGICGLAVGSIWKAVKGEDGFVTLEGRSPDEIKILLEKLKRRARFDGYMSKMPEAVYSPRNDKEENFRRKYIETLIKVKERDPFRKASPESFQRFHFTYSPTYTSYGDIDNLRRLFKNAGFGDSKPGGSIWGLSYGPTAFPKVEGQRKISVESFSIEFSISKKYAVGFGYSADGGSTITGYNMIRLDRTDYWGRQYYSDLYLKGNFSSRNYYLSGAWKYIPDGFINRISTEVGIGIGIIQFDLSYRTSAYKYSDSGDMGTMTYEDRKLRPFFIAFSELDYFMSRSWSIGLKIHYKLASINVEAIDLVGQYVDLDVDNNLIYTSVPVHIPSHKINAGGFGIGITFGLHF